ncbi:hypothetical protein F7725_003873 [Dissostichus mawsoni]|uniref:Uncharacterized protein n=1 Tax=Dissostichus mawsoni TaxID=36200 RepID=A0A7J5YBJ8_DISMA|nr:hypothetical protein F7725_003873 [Dissostichus mawsoni]
MKRKRDDTERVGKGKIPCVQPSGSVSVRTVTTVSAAGSSAEAALILQWISGRKIGRNRRSLREEVEEEEEKKREEEEEEEEEGWMDGWGKDKKRKKERKEKNESKDREGVPGWLCEESPSELFQGQFVGGGSEQRGGRKISIMALNECGLLCKYTLFIFNLIFALVGFVFLGLGLWLRSSDSTRAFFEFEDFSTVTVLIITGLVMLIVVVRLQRETMPSANVAVVVLGVIANSRKDELQCCGATGKLSLDFAKETCPDPDSFLDPFTMDACPGVIVDVFINKAPLVMGLFVGTGVILTKREQQEITARYTTLQQEVIKPPTNFVLQIPRRLDELLTLSYEWLLTLAATPAATRTTNNPSSTSPPSSIICHAVDLSVFLALSPISGRQTVKYKAKAHATTCVAPKLMPRHQGLAKEAALKEARLEVASKPWLRSLLPEWLSIFTSSPESLTQASNPFLGSGLAWELLGFVFLGLGLKLRFSDSTRAIFEFETLNSMVTVLIIMGSVMLIVVVFGDNGPLLTCFKSPFISYLCSFTAVERLGYRR